jgi:hypothetical protein
MKKYSESEYFFIFFLTSLFWCSGPVAVGGSGDLGVLIMTFFTQEDRGVMKSISI